MLKLGVATAEVLNPQRLAITRPCLSLLACMRVTEETTGKEFHCFVLIRQQGMVLALKKLLVEFSHAKYCTPEKWPVMNK